MWHSGLVEIKVANPCLAFLPLSFCLKNIYPSAFCLTSASWTKISSNLRLHLAINPLYVRKQAEAFFWRPLLKRRELGCRIWTQMSVRGSNYGTIVLPELQKNKQPWPITQCIRNFIPWFQKVKPLSCLRGF